MYKNKRIILVIVLAMLLCPNKVYGAVELSIHSGSADTPGCRAYVYSNPTYLEIGNSDVDTWYDTYIFVPQGYTVRLHRNTNSAMASLGYDQMKWFGKYWSNYFSSCYTVTNGGTTHSWAANTDDSTIAEDLRNCYFTTMAHSDTSEDAVTSELAYLKSQINSWAGRKLNTGWRAGICNHIYFIIYGYRVNYIANGATFSATGLKWRYYSTATFNAPSTNPTRTGYTFKGWALTSGEVVSPTASGAWTHSLTNTEFRYMTSDSDTGFTNRDKTFNLYAQWSASPYTIHFDNNGGTGDTTAQTYYINDATTTLRTPTRPGYTFSGWKIVSGSTEGWQSSINSSTYITVVNSGSYGELYLQAQWTEKKYDVKWSVSGVGGSLPSTQNITYLQNCAARTFSISNKHFEISSVTKTVNLDGDVTGPTSLTVTDPKSFTYPASQVLGETTISVTTTRVSEDLTITRNNLEGNDCSVVTVTRSPETSPAYTVILSAQSPSVTLDRLPLGTYYIEETSWAATYTRATSQTVVIQASDTSDTRTVTLSGAKQPQSLYWGENHK